MLDKRFSLLSLLSLAYCITKHLSVLHKN